MAFTIGLTGGIATGKSTVSNMFYELNIPVIDADIIARIVVEPGRQAYKQIVDQFGEKILQADLTIDRKKLGNIIFSDAQQREKLNHIVHPAIRQEMDDQRKAFILAGEKTIVFDIPLLFENKLTHLVDQVIVVSVHEDLQLERLKKRDKISTHEALKRIQSQMPLKEKVEQADEIIDNSESLKCTERQLHTILRKWTVLGSA